MSEPTRHAANKTVTIWFRRSSGIGFGDPETYDVVTTTACYEQGGSRQYTDANGSMFTPQSTYWFEVLSENPRLNDFIALGDQSAIAKPSDAEKAEAIRIVALQDCSTIGDIDDLKVIT